MTRLRELTCDQSFAKQQQPQQQQPEPQQSPLNSSTTLVRKPKKAHHHKVKTGCYTCRKRRVKCDEAKPVCQTCTRLSYECRGYSQLEPVRLVAAPPPTTLHGRDEHQAFQFFMGTTMQWFDLKTGPCITECHVDEFWNPVVLQITASEPAIKHILLAWAELHRRILYGPVGPNEPFENDFFWRNHSQALRILGSRDQVDVSVMLIACIMFCILENFRGRKDIFLTHLESGIKILNDYDHASLHQKQSICDDMISRYIRPILRTFQVNLSNILEFELLQPKERMTDRLIKLRQAGRVVKSWN